MNQVATGGKKRGGELDMQPIFTVPIHSDGSSPSINASYPVVHSSKQPHPAFAKSTEIYMEQICETRLLLAVSYPKRKLTCRFESDQRRFIGRQIIEGHGKEITIRSRNYTKADRRSGDG